MQLIDNLSEFFLASESVLTIGAFDGVHVGHQHLISQVVRRAGETHRFAGLVTFHPHPVAVLAPQVRLRYLTTPGDQAAVFEKLGLKVVAILTFDRKMADTTASEFASMLSQHLHMKELWVGADFVMGRDRQGDINALRMLGRRLGYSLRVVEPYLLDGTAVSSTRIRNALDAGDVREAARLLGRYQSLAGEVVEGAHRGRSLGYPTANLEVREEHAIPADGVYAVYALLGTECHLGVASIGVRPTFDNGRRTVETYILDFDEDIYGCDLVVQFVQRLRGEERFQRVSDLVAQIGRDVANTRAILEREAVVAEGAAPCGKRSSTPPT